MAPVGALLVIAVACWAERRMEAGDACALKKAALGNGLGPETLFVIVGQICANGREW